MGGWPIERLSQNDRSLLESLRATVEWHHHYQPRSAWVGRLELRLSRRLRCLHLLRALGWGEAPLPLMGRLRAVVSLVPKDAGAPAAARGLLANLNAADLAAFADLGASPRRPLLAIVSCRPRLGRARRCLEDFLGRRGWDGVVPVIVVGNGRLPDWRFRFDACSRILEVPAPDSYEGLAAKVMTLTLVASLLPGPPALLKADDDCRPGDPFSLAATLERMVGEGAMAAGYPIATTSPLDLDRAWHVGRSSRANLRPFDTLGTRRWISGGVGYLLSGAAVQELSAYALHSWGFVRTMLYEDVCVSMLLEAAGAPVHWMENTRGLGIATERQEEIDRGMWATPAKTS